MKNIVEFWIEHEALFNNDFFCYKHSDEIDDEAIAEQMVEEILSLTMMETYYGCVGNFTIDTLMNLFSNFNAELVKKVFQSQLVSIYISDRNGQIRITDNYDLRRAAMDFCGLLYAGYGFNVPEPEENETSIIDAAYAFYNKNGQKKLTQKEIDNCTAGFFEDLSGMSVFELAFEVEESSRYAVTGNSTRH